MNYNPYSLDGKIVLVTGASSGIGRVTAVECSKMGAKVIVTGRNSEKLKETFDNLVGDGHIMVTADLNQPEDIEKLVAEIPQIDGFVNNAGVDRNKPINFIKKEDLDFIYQTNVFAGMLLNKALLEKKKFNKGASIVFTSSISSKLNTPGLAMYASSKAALASYMRSCAVELANKGVRSNAVHPGMVETKLIQDAAYSTEDMEKDKAFYPLKRYGKPEDVAFAIIYLLSDAASWVTGTSLVVDGGRLLK